MKYKKNKPYNNNRLYGGMVDSSHMSRGGGKPSEEEEQSYDDDVCFRRKSQDPNRVDIVLQDEAGAESENIIVKLHDSDEKGITRHQTPTPPGSEHDSKRNLMPSAPEVARNDASDAGKRSGCFEFQAISKTIGPKSIARVSTPTRRAVSSDSDGSVTDEDNLEAKKMVAKNIQREEDEEGAQGFKQNVKYTLSSNAQAVSPDSAFRVFKDNLKAKKTVENKRNREEMKLKFVEANKKRKDEIDKKQIDKLKQDIETEYKECKKKLDEIDVQKQVFVSTKQESENPEKIEINIKRKALYDKIEENSNELEKLYQETLSISSAGERYELQEKRTQYDKGKEKEKRVELRKEKILEQITTREDKERDDRDAEIRKLKNEILVLQKNKSINESKLSVLKNNLLATERLKVKDQDGWVNKDDDEEIRRLTRLVGQATIETSKWYKRQIFDRREQISKSNMTMEALHKKKIVTQTAAIEILKETIDRESGEEERAERTLQRLEEQNKELIAKLESKIDKEDKKGGAVERPPPQNQSPPSEYIVVGDPKHTVKKLQDIKRKMKELCLEINNKFITIKSEDSRFYELLKREEEVTKEEKEKLMIEQHEEEEKLKMLKENVDKEVKEDLDLIDAKEEEEERKLKEKEEEEERKLKEKEEEEEIRKKEEDDKEKQIELLKLKTEKQNKSYGNINRLLAQLIGALKEQYIDETESETESESEEDA